MSSQGVNCECARLVESATAKHQTAKVALQVNGIIDGIYNLHMRQRAHRRAACCHKPARREI